jgi:hypothetical protein
MDKLMDQTPSTFVIGAIKPRERVESIVKQLQAAGIPDKDISLIAPDDREGRDPADEKPRENADRVHDLTVGAAAGGIAMGALGCLVGLASLAIPALGLFIVAGATCSRTGRCRGRWCIRRGCGWINRIESAGA